MTTGGPGFGLAGQVALVTGAGGGIGTGVARSLADAGASVVLHAHRRTEAVKALADGIAAAGGSAHWLSADLTRPDEPRELVGAAAAWRGRLDAVVHCAGVQPVQELAGMSDAAWREVIDADLHAAFGVVQAAAAHMSSRQGGGSITAIASVEGSRPAHGHAHYSAAKAALIMFARAAAGEYGPAGIRVNTVSPGLIDRPGLAGDWPDGVRRWTAAAPLTRLGSPADVGAACVFLASPAASWITGHDLVVDGGVSTRPGW
ncbi:SDR family NAD(P)-dependent oxidoreductase [Streptomyces sp. NPDC058691]|uniref:SDR family NAD(P)-dependent oxidoreductase n=1 Tax=Streptomyces sp. NPDC058691 TaxID=3346601 RepID=UPI0036620C43